jgi:S-adenosylmethionine-diacylglycerol 3-amino-3-carboxypropyl transferase
MSACVAPTRPMAAAQVLAGELRYSRVWEDHALIDHALTITPKDDVLMIASAGCNVLNLLLHEPRRIVAIDLNPSQTALLELKIAAARMLDHAGFLELLGVTRGHALQRYDAVRRLLSWDARTWWDANIWMLAYGVERTGRLDRFIGDFQRDHVARLHPPELIDRLFATRDLTARQRLVDEELLTPEFIREFLAYFTRDSLAGRGRHPAQFRYVQELDVAGWFLARFRWACTALPVRGNFYLERFLRDERSEPAWRAPYLRPENYERLQRLVSRVEVVTSDVESYLAERPATFTKAALSDVFEYMSPEAAERSFAALAEAMPAGGRLAYWNLFVPRESPASLRDRIRPLPLLARALWRRDRAWFYSAFHVDEVVAPW